MSELLVLAIDTSAGSSVAVVRGDAVLARAEVVSARGHAENLAPLIAAALESAGTTVRDLGAVAVGTGPAPFTGLRVGLVTAAALGEALGIPVWGVSSLEGWAAAGRAGESGSDYHPPLVPRGSRQTRHVLRSDSPDRPSGVGRVRVVTDARRREVYTAVYELADAEPGGLRVVEAPRVAAPAGIADLVAAERGEGVAIVGPNLYPELLGESTGVFDVARLARIGAARAAAGAATPAEPLYLRRPDVHGVPGGPA